MSTDDRAVLLLDVVLGFVNTEKLRFLVGSLKKASIFLIVDVRLKIERTCEPFGNTQRSFGGLGGCAALFAYCDLASHSLAFSSSFSTP